MFKVGNIIPLWAVVVSNKTKSRELIPKVDNIIPLQRVGDSYLYIYTNKRVIGGLEGHFLMGMGFLYLEQDKLVPIKTMWLMVPLKSCFLQMICFKLIKKSSNFLLCL